jgi:4-amino-4-deoxy-L-arabinose transferase-like glycosyltransferase
MNSLLILATVLVVAAFVAIAAFDGAAALLLVAVLTVATVALIRRKGGEDAEYLTNLFVLALLVRLGFGLFIHHFNLRQFFGGDANTFDSLGKQIVGVWTGVESAADPWSQRAMSTSSPGWGIHYLTGVIYYIFGPNILAAQSFCAVFGAATAPLVYLCSREIYNNRRVGKVAALLVALFPAFVIWSSQLLKDGLIIFLLVLAMTVVLQLQKRMSYSAVMLLIFAMFGILALRFYIFYMVAISVAGSFVIGQSGSVKTTIRGLVAMLIVGLALTYLGVLRTATENFDQYATLEKVQISRADLARSAESGFGEEVDVSTTEGAISAIPIGLTYLMLAPFPWQMATFRQAITLPEILVWWAMMPLLISGIIYTVRHRLRAAIPVLIFTGMLSVAYSIFQGNVGTAYRQRTQIQVFLFIFIAVGWSLIQERRELRSIDKVGRRRPVRSSLS